MIDAQARVTGEIDFTINVIVPDMLHAAVLRSTSPHARFRVDVSRSRRIPGVHAILTGAGILSCGTPKAFFGPVLRDRPILAVDKVRHVGEPVVAAAAVDYDTALAAVELAEIDYEELPPVFDIDAALAEGSPLVHETPPMLGPTYADVIVEGGGASNICNAFRLRHGDIEEGFSHADYVFDNVFESPAVQHIPLETHACVADVRERSITIWATTQIPYILRSQLAELFGFPPSAVRVIVPPLGGSYGSKCYPSIEPIAAALSFASKRPVRFHLTREEEFVTITKHAARIRMRTGVRKDGTIVAREVRADFNTGAYADIGPRLIRNGGFGTAGPTEIPHVSIDSYAVYTNLPPAGAFRGYGISQAAWAYETQMDMIAEALSVDPYEMRLRNLLDEGQTFATGEVVRDCHFKELLSTVAERIGWNEQGKHRVGSRVRSKGLACIIKGTVTPSTATAAARLDEDGTLQVLSSSVEMGQGSRTALATIAASELGLPLEKVRVVDVDTEVTPYDQQTSSSRTTHAMGSALLAALEEIKEELRRYAARLLSVTLDDIVMRDGHVFLRGGKSPALTYEDVIRQSAIGNIIGRGIFQSSGGLDPDTGQGVASVHWHQAAGAAEVEVDLETGLIKVLRYEAAVYAGKVINPVLVELQTEGNIAFGIGQALFEEMLYDNGQLQNPTLADYMIASFRDMPDELGATALEGAAGAEVHGVGEMVLPTVMPAIGNAVARATGVRLTELPITAERVLRGLRAGDELLAGAQLEMRA